MANRTTEVAVRAIVDATASSITNFIEVANNMVTKHCATLDDTTAEMVERYLSAYFVSISERRTKGEKAGSVAENFQGKVDLGLDFNEYGQTAMQLDWTGGLSQHNQAIKTGKKYTPVIAWLGTAYDDLDTDS